MFKVIVLVLTAVAAAQAGLVPVRRNQPAPMCKCGSSTSPVEYYPADVNAALAQATSHPIQGPVTVNGKTRNPKEYPHLFFNKDVPKITFPHCPGATTYYEFPIFPGGALYTPQSNPLKRSKPPGTDRIVYDQNHDFCGCISHIDHSGNPLPNNGFVDCPV